MTEITPELTFEAHRAAMSNTDDADTRTVLLAVLACAQAWEGDVRILGNVRASDAVRALAVALSSEPVVWVIPGSDNARSDGFLDAMAWKEGEFTRPLYAALSSRSAEAGKPVVKAQAPQQYRAIHDAATAAYEANTSTDFRYSASALRKAVDAALAALSALSTPADSEPVGYVTASNMRALKGGLQGVMTTSAVKNAHFSEPLYAAPMADIEPVSVPEAVIRKAAQVAIDELIDRMDGKHPGDDDLADYLRRIPDAITRALAAAPQPNPSADDAR